MEKCAPKELPKPRERHMLPITDWSDLYFLC